MVTHNINKIVRILIWIPLLLRNWCWANLPRSLFIMTYTPSSDNQRQIETDAKNLCRSLTYYIKKSNLIAGENQIDQ